MSDGPVIGTCPCCGVARVQLHSVDRRCLDCLYVDRQGLCVFRDEPWHRPVDQAAAVGVS